MIVGYFDARQPLVQGRLRLPEFDTEDDVIFLLDTGASGSCLMPDDSRRFGIDYGRLIGIPSYSRGVGGFVESVQVPAIVMFREANGLRRFYRLQIDVMPDRRELRETPSLLGQDILAYWRTLHDPTRGILQATVVTAHGTYRL